MLLWKKFPEYSCEFAHLNIKMIPISRSTLSFSEFSQLFVRYGLVIIDGVEANPEATEKLCREIAPIHDTYYGAFWVFSNESKGVGGQEGSSSN